MPEILKLPDYEAVDASGYVHLNRFISGVVHLFPSQNLPANAVQVRKWIGEYWSLDGSWVVLCGVLLRPDHRGLCLMKPDPRYQTHKLNPHLCPQCLRLAPGYHGPRKEETDAS